MFQRNLIAATVLGATVIPALHSQAADQVLEEIVVTARKKAEVLSDIPISVAAFSGAAMKRTGIENVTDMLRSTNGVQYDSSGSVATGTITIRGLSQPGLVGDETNVPVFVNGVFASGRESAFVPFSALERVEVLRGPQSALFGKSAFAGAVNYVSKTAHSDVFEGEIEAHSGSGEQRGASIGLNIPLTDTFAMRLDGYYNETGGTHKDPDEGYVLGNRETEHGRIAFFWQASDALSVDFSYANNKNDDAVQPGFAQTRNGGIKIKPKLYYSDVPGLNSINNVTFDGNPLAPDFAPGPPNFNNGSYTTTGIPAKFFNQFTVTDPNAVFQEEAPGRHLGQINEGQVFGGIKGLSEGSTNDSENLILNLSYDAGDYVLTSITGYAEAEYEGVVGYNQTVEFFSPHNGSFDVFGSWGARPNNERRDLSQELRVSFADGGELNWAAGLYYGNNQRDETYTNSVIYQGLDGNPDLSSPDYIAGNGRPLVTDVTSFTTETRAIFGSVSWNFSENFNLTFEARNTWEDKTANNTKIADHLSARGEQPTGLDEATFSYFTPRVTLDYKFNDNDMVYANIAKGVKAGGINGGVSGAEAAYDPEENITYEIGAKLLAFDGRARINLSAYMIDWTQQQINGFSSNIVEGEFPDTIVRNLGETEVKGLEAEIRFQIAPAWALSAAYAFNDSEVKEGVSSNLFGFSDYEALDMSPVLYPATDIGVIDFAVSPFIPVGEETVTPTDVYVSSGDLSGKRLPGTAKQTFRMGADFIKEFDGYSLYSQVSTVWKDKRYLDAMNSQWVGASWDVNFTAGVETEEWRLGLNISNLLGDDTPTTAYNPYTSDGKPTAYGMARNGRMFNLTGAYKF